MSLADAPITPKLLGFGGLIPFFACPIGAFVLHGAYGAEAGGAGPGAGPGGANMMDLLAGLLILVQVLYAAMIASFMGAIHWGVSLRLNEPDAVNRGRYIFSVMPALAAWIIVILYQVWGAIGLVLILFMGVFALIYFFDRGQHSLGILPAWYLSLRKWLTLGVILSLALSIAFLRFG